MFKKIKNNPFIYFVVIFFVSIMLQRGFSNNTTPMNPVPQSERQTEILWENWYTVTLNQNTPYGYYMERLEIRRELKNSADKNIVDNSRYFFKNSFWKKEEGFINEEHTGALASISPFLKPILYNYHSKYRATETNIDGTIDANGKTFRTSFQQPGAPPEVYKSRINKNTIFSVFFPVWLKNEISNNPPGKKTIKFNAILEDQPKIKSVSGWIKIQEPDEIATKTKTTRILVKFGASQSLWFINQDGVTERIEKPDAGMLVQRVTKQDALDFLNPPLKKEIKKNQ